MISTFHNHLAYSDTFRLFIYLQGFMCSVDGDNNERSHRMIWLRAPSDGWSEREREGERGKRWRESGVVRDRDSHTLTHTHTAE